MRITLALTTLALTTLCACQSAELGVDESDGSAVTLLSPVNCDAAFSRINTPPPGAISYQGRLAIVGAGELTAASFGVHATPTTVESEEPDTTAETEFYRVAGYARLQRRTQLIAGRAYPYAQLDLSFLFTTPDFHDLEQSVRVSSCAVDGERVTVKASFDGREVVVVYSPVRISG
jgi:hypothetical protein